MEIRLRMAGYSISHVARPCDEDLAPVSLPRGGVQRARNHSSNSAVKQLAEVLSLQDRIFGPKFRLTGVHQAHLLLRTIRNFCQSADPEIVSEHVPRYGRLLGASEAILADVVGWARSEATILWEQHVYNTLCTNPVAAAIFWVPFTV
jgi:hypothetical protein